MAGYMTVDQVRDALRPHLGSDVVEHTTLCDGALRVLLRYAPYRDTLDMLSKRVESYLFDTLYDYLGDSMTVLLDNGQLVRIHMRELPMLADEVMGVLFRSMQVYSITYEKLRDYAMRSGSLCAMRTLRERFGSFLSPEERTLMERILQDRSGEASASGGIPAGRA